jgi:hypothetical protein
MIKTISPDTVRLTIKPDNWNFKTKKTDFAIRSEFHKMGSNEPDKNILGVTENNEYITGSTAVYRPKDGLFDCRTNHQNLMVTFEAPRLLDTELRSNVNPVNAEEFYQGSNEILDQVERAGVVIHNRDQIKLSRLDLFKHIETDHPLEYFSPVFHALKMNRSKRDQVFKDGFLFTNKSAGFCVYDKIIAELMKHSRVHSEANIKRAEVRAMVSKSVQSMFDLYYLNDLYNNFNKLPDYYYEWIKMNVLKDDLFSQELSELYSTIHAFRKLYPKCYVSKLLENKGLSVYCDTFGGRKGLQNVLIAMDIPERTARELINRHKQPVELQDTPEGIQAKYREFKNAILNR